MLKKTKAIKICKTKSNNKRALQNTTCYYFSLVYIYIVIRLLSLYKHTHTHKKSTKRKTKNTNAVKICKKKKIDRFNFTKFLILRHNW